MRMASGVRLGLRGPFRLTSQGYVKFFRRETLPNDDTGIVALTETERRDFLIRALTGADKARNVEVQRWIV